MDENNQNPMEPMQPMEPMNPVQPDNTQNAGTQTEGQYTQYQAPQPEQTQYQQYQVPQQNYQQPQYQTTQPQGGSGFGVAALVLGIMALLLCWIPYVNITCTILAFILGIIGIAKNSGKGQAIAGVVLSVIAAIPTIIIMMFLNAIFGALGWFGAHIDNATEYWFNTNSSSVSNSVSSFVNDLWGTAGNYLNTIGDGLNTVGNELNSLSNRVDTNTTNTTGNTTVTTTSKPSSVSSPAAIGEWTTAASYKDGEYIDTPVRVDKVLKGSEAEAAIKATGKTMTSKLQDGCEWIVINYSVDTTDLQEYSSGRTITSLSFALRGMDGGSLKYDGKTYILTGSNLLSTSGIKTTIYNGQYVFQLPKGCTNYLIQAKSTKGSEAFIKGE